MKRLTIIGHFAFGKEFLDGQTVKTKILTEEIERRFGESEVLKVDTHGKKTKLLLLPFVLINKLRTSKNIVILPAQNGIQIIAPLLVLENILFGRKLHYVVIGGWLSEFIKNKPFLSKNLKKFNRIYVETNTMKTNLEAHGFSNIVVMSNCKKLNILDEKQLVYTKDAPYSLCTFSRVMREKGIQDAVEAVKHVNEKYGKTVFTLDIYGPVDDGQADWFEQEKSTFPDYISYKGSVPFDKSVEVLKSYFALMFPTRFYTEGIPGTIIDAYAAGVPVISARWESFSDIIHEHVNGLGYDFMKVENLKNLLLNIAEKPEIINDMKANCVLSAMKFIPETAMDILVNNL